MIVKHPSGIAGVMYYPPPNWHTASYNALAIDAAGEKASLVTPAPRAGNISHVGIRINAATTPQPVKVSLQGLVAGGANPDGIIKGAGNNGFGVIATPAANTFYEVALGAVVAVSLGDPVVIVAEFDATVGNVTISTYFIGNNCLTDNRVWSQSYTTAWQSKSTQGSICATLKYDDGNYYAGNLCPALSMTGANLANNTIPDEVGNYFTPTYPMFALGISVFAEMDGTADLVIYDDVDSVVASATFDSDYRNSLGINRHDVYFAAGVYLWPGRQYRVVLKPTSTGNCNIQRYTMSSVAAMACTPMDAIFRLCHRTDAGAWTDTTDQLATISLMVAGYESGVRQHLRTA